MPRTLVTGVEGMIGGATMKRLCGACRVTAAVAFTDVGAPGYEIPRSPLQDASMRERGVRDRPFFAIVHRGAITWPLLAQVNPPAIINANIVGLANFSSLTTKHNHRRFVFRSSIGVYGNAPGGPRPEQHSLNPISRYVNGDRGRGAERVSR